MILTLKIRVFKSDTHRILVFDFISFLSDREYNGKINKSKFLFNLEII